MGSGKSRVGRALASRLGWDFIDTDERIERAAGLTVAELFAREGEAGFRARERAAIESLPTHRCVVALGGGAVVAGENRALLRGKGTLVWLDARPETLVERIGDASARPLLAGLDQQARIARLAALRAERAVFYGEAQIRIDTEGRDVAAVCDALVAALSDRNAA
jgi:shikimate kinase